MADFENSGFELAADEEVLGEALGWIWDATQAVGEFVRFNPSAIDENTSPTEGFVAWWKVPWTLDYADETARLAATGFSEEDLETIAIQRDDNSLWRLTGYGPTEWTEVDTPFIQWWLDSFAEGTEIEAEFQVIGEDETIELFNLIEEGPAWADSWTETPAQFGSWFDEGVGEIARGSAVEGFDDGWDSSLFATESRWVPTMDSRLIGSELSFPVTIRPGQNYLWIYRDLWNDVVRLDITPGEYATAAALAANIEAEWSDASPHGTIFQWSYEGDSLVLRWVATPGSEQITLCMMRSQSSSDARPFIGFDSFGPNGGAGAVPMPQEYLDSSPAGTGDDDVFVLDQWGSLGAVSDYSAELGGWFPRPWGEQRALFDSGVTFIEAIDFSEWFAEPWSPSLADGFLTFASFDTESGPSAVESFEDSWADYEF